MVIIWYVLFFIVLFFLVFFLRKRYANRDSRTDNIKAKKEDFNPEFSSKPENDDEEETNSKK